MTTTAPGRGRGFRGRAALALLLHLFIVGFIPMGEAFHEHEHSLDPESYTYGSHQHEHEHDDEAATECLLLLGTTSTGLTSDVSRPAVCLTAERFVSDITAEAPRPALPLSAVTARGPPSR